MIFDYYKIRKKKRNVYLRIVVREGWLWLFAQLFISEFHVE